MQALGPPRYPRETREMSLFSRLVLVSKSTQDTSLPEFIARRRRPGVAWRTWDEVVHDLANVVGELVSNATLRKWAKRYNIPERTTPDGQGMDHDAFTAHVAEHGITL